MEPVAGPSIVHASRTDRKTAGNTSTGATNGVFKDIPFETNDFVENPTPGFISKPNNTDFTLAFPGVYRCLYALTASPGANDVGWEMRAVLDGNLIPQSRARGSGRGNAAENFTVTRSFLFRTTLANQVLKIQAAPTEGVAVNIVSEYSVCTVELVRLT